LAVSHFWRALSSSVVTGDCFAQMRTSVGWLSR
jgi:hypothetical protein